MSNKLKVWQRLRALRDRTGMSREALGKEINMPGTTFATYDTNAFKKDYLPVDLVERLMKVLPGKGDPPITPAEIWELSGVSPIAQVEAGTMYGNVPTAIPSDIQLAPSFKGVAEMDVIAGMGIGGSAEEHNFTLASGEIISADAVRDIWTLPDRYLAGELRITTKRARIIEVRGDSMEPTLHSGDRVMIDMGDQTLAQEGIFAIWAGDGVSVKRVERVRPSQPPMLRLISDNDRHRAVELPADQVQIIGRVVWVARKM